jgi:cell division septation protein DedD
MTIDEKNSKNKLMNVVSKVTGSEVKSDMDIDKFLTEFASKKPAAAPKKVAVAATKPVAAPKPVAVNATKPVAAPKPAAAQEAKPQAVASTAKPAAVAPMPTISTAVVNKAPLSPIKSAVKPAPLTPAAKVEPKPQIHLQDIAKLGK